MPTSGQADARGGVGGGAQDGKFAQRSVDEGRGHVRLVEQRGGDMEIARAASRPGRSVDEGQGGGVVWVVAGALVEGETSALDAAAFTLQFRCPALVAACILPRACGAVAGLVDEFYMPPAEAIAVAGAGSQAGATPLGETGLEMIEAAFRVALSTYTALVGAGVRREVAQVVLPLATYAEFTETLTARQLLDVFGGGHVPPAAEPYRTALLETFRERLPLTADAAEQSGYLVVGHGQGTG